MILMVVLHLVVLHWEKATPSQSRNVGGGRRSTDHQLRQYECREKLRKKKSSVKM